MKEWLLNFNNLFKANHDLIGWMPDVIAIFLVTMLLHQFEKRVLRRFTEKARFEKNYFVDSLIYSIKKPLAWLIWFLGFTFIAYNIQTHFKDAIQVDWIDKIRQIGLVLTFAWGFFRFIQRFEENYSKKSKKLNNMSKTSILALGRVFRILVVVICVLVILPILNINIAPILTLGGAGTIVAGLAAKDVLANFFGGFMLFMDRPFSVGDWIRSPDKQIEGTVEHIGWRLTRIRTFDKRPLYVPNSVFLLISIENPSRMTNRRIREFIGLRYQDAEKIPVISKAIEDMLRLHEDIDQNQTIFVTLHQLSDSSLDLLLYCFTKTTNWVEFQHVQQDVFVKIAAVVKEHGGDMAFPTRTLDIPQDMLAAVGK